MNEDVKTKACTLLFLRQDDKILLAMKKRGFGANKYNGVGGKIEPSETPDIAAIRETKEEIGVTPLNFKKIAENDFIYEINGIPSKRMYTNVYICDRWQGRPTESEEMAPKWFNIKDIPYDKMWPDDIHWLPKVLSDSKVMGTFRFDENNIMLSHQVKIIDKLPSE